MSTLNVKVIEAHDIKAADITGYSDPYIKILYFPKGFVTATQEKQTKVLKERIAPVWKEEFEFKLGGDEDEIVFELYDYDRFTKDDFLGEVRLTVGKLKELKEAWLPFRDKPGQHDPTISGKLRIAASVS